MGEDVTLVKIGDTILNDPAPAPPYAFSKKEMDLDSGRNLNGVMQRNILPHHVHTLSLKFPPMDENQMSRLLNLLDNPYMQVTAYDPFTKSLETYTMMHGDLNPSIDLFVTDRIMYNEFSVELVEY